MELEAYPRFCWLHCDDVDEIYTINVEAYSMGCSGPDYTYDNIKVEVLNSPTYFALCAWYYDDCLWG